ncbi:unnamed protein product [Alopecurus aequalis]
MAATGHSWADLNSELLVSIAAAAAVQGSSLFYYECLRSICAAWRSALPPPYPCLLSLNDDHARSASVFSFPMRRSFLLYKGFEGCLDVPETPSCAGVFGSAGNGRLARVVGSGNGRLAVAMNSSIGKHTCVSFWTVSIFVLDPRAGDVVELLPPRGPTNEVEDCMYVVRKLVFAPDPDDATVVAMCGRGKIAYVDTSKSRSRRKLDLVWTTVDVIAWDTKRLVDLAFDATGGKVYCLDSSGGMHVLRVHHGGQNSQEAPAERSLTLLPAAAFDPPYNVASTLTSTKHLFFCHGSLYQVWQNDSSTIRLCSGLTMSADEIFVLRYDQDRQSWNVVKDLGGCSVFIGKNSSPAVVQAGTVLAVRSDCVYWIDWRCVPMVCDLATGTSKRCVFPGRAPKGNCWYFGDHNMRRTNSLM